MSDSSKPVPTREEVYAQIANFKLLFDHVDHKVEETTLEGAMAAHNAANEFSTVMAAYFSDKRDNEHDKALATLTKPCSELEAEGFINPLQFMQVFSGERIFKLVRTMMREAFSHLREELYYARGPEGRAFAEKCDAESREMILKDPEAFGYQPDVKAEDLLPPPRDSTIPDTSSGLSGLLESLLQGVGISSTALPGGGQMIAIPLGSLFQGAGAPYQDGAEIQTAFQGGITVEQAMTEQVELPNGYKGTVMQSPVGLPVFVEEDLNPAPAPADGDKD